MRITLCRCETAGDEFVKCFDGANCESDSGFESGLEVVEGGTVLPLIRLQDSNASNV
jgi:hypothetical protein